MSFDGFTDVEIQKMSKGKARRPEVKLARNIPCHTKTKQVVLEEEKDENQNRRLATSENESFVPVTVNDKPVETPVVFEVAPAHDLRSHVPKHPPEAVAKDDKSNKFHDFELHRKLMEEQNKMKRNLLQQAISKHTEKTQAEDRKLQEIRKALEVLDSELASDVLILRKQIETAALHYNNVEKHYNAIERTFLKAKQDLYQAHEKKEMLTEHLYTIIAHNEDRKAKKLSELMERVGLTLDNGT